LATEPGGGPAPATLRAQGRISESDYVSAQFLHLRPAPVVLSLLGLVAVGLLVALALTQSVLLLATIAGVAAYVLLVMPLRARRLYRRSASIAAPQTIEIGAEGLSFQREKGPSLLRWSQIQRWRANRSLVLLYPVKSGFYLVPAAFFSQPGDFTAFVALLQQHAGAGS